jgi:hypothetical protein
VCPIHGWQDRADSTHCSSLFAHRPALHRVQGSRLAYFGAATVIHFLQRADSLLFIIKMNGFSLNE